MIDPIGTDAGGFVSRITGGQLKAVDLASACLARVATVDGELGAFVRLSPQAQADAAEVDRRLEQGERLPLAGVPIAIKDNINTAGLETDCASAGLAGFVPPRDATVVQRLRRAGAVILGKTNLDQYGMGSSTENSIHGPTRNPWDTTRVPGGSSGGSAVAVAAGMAPLALGSDTGGSVRQPAAFCGVFGLKPTYGRVSRYGLIAFGSSFDQVGPLARSTADIARLLSVIAGGDPADSTCSDAPRQDYLAACQRGIDGVRIGIPKEYLDQGLDPEVDQAVRSGATELEKHGARLEEVSLPHTRYAIPTYYLLATAEASSNLARFDAVRYGNRVDPGCGLTPMYAASRAAWFGAEVQRRIMLGTYALSAGYYDAFYGRAQRVRGLVRQDFLDVFERGVDLLWMPTTPTPAFAIGERVDDPLAMYLSDVYTTTASLAGIPALAVPLGRSATGLPLSGQLVGPAFDESGLLAAAGVLEGRFPVELPPDRTAA